MVVLWTCPSSVWCSWEHDNKDKGNKTEGRTQEMIKIIFILFFVLLFSVSVNSLNVGYGNNNNYVSIGSPPVVDTSNEKDPRWSANLTNMLVDASAGNCIYGFFGNGSIKPRACSGGAGGSSYNESYEKKLDSLTGNKTYAETESYENISGTWNFTALETYFDYAVVNGLTARETIESFGSFELYGDLYMSAGKHLYPNGDNIILGDMALGNNLKNVISDYFSADGINNYTINDLAKTSNDSYLTSQQINYTANLTLVNAYYSFWDNAMKQNITNTRWMMNETQACNMSFWNMYHTQWESSNPYNSTYLSKMVNTQTDKNISLAKGSTLSMTKTSGKNVSFNMLDEVMVLPYVANVFEYIFGVDIQSTTGLGFNYSSGEIEARRSGTAQFKAGVGAYSEGQIYLNPHSITVGGACNKGYFASNMSGSFCQCIGTSGTTGTWKCQD